MKIILSSLLILIQLLSGSYQISNLQLVNKNNPIKKELTIKEMTKIPGTSVYAQKEAGQAASKFLEAIKKAGYKNIRITSGYRTYAYQKQLFDNRVNIFRPIYKEKAEEMATTRVARPGTSEHQIGLGFDISYGTGDAFIGTPASKWMAKNCAPYGFVLRYPKGKEQITGVMYEPWHFRYVGVELAKYLTDNDLTLEEFYEQLSYATTKAEIQNIMDGKSSRKDFSKLLEDRLKTVYYKDIPYHSPYHDIIHQAMEMAIITDSDQDNFTPHGPITYREFFKMLLMGNGMWPDDSASSEDPSADPIIVMANKLQILQENVEIDWESPVKRSDVPFFLCKAVGLSTEETGEDIFSDRVGKDNTYVNAAYHAGLFLGILDSKGNRQLGEGELKRVEALTVCIRAGEFSRQNTLSAAN